MKLSSLLSPVLHGIFRPLKRPLLECRAAAVAQPTWPPLRIVHRPLPKAEGLTAIVIHKERSRIREIAGHVGWLETRNGFSTAWRRLGAILDLVADGEIGDGEWTADLGDWVRQPGPVIGFCSNRDDSLLVPDRGFHASRGYARERQAAARAPAFIDRDPRIVWRGSPTGQGHAVADPLSPTDLTLVQRVRMCLLLREVPDPLRGHVDARIAVGRRMPRAQADAYGRAGIAGDHVAQSSWCHRRYAIDIDGHANAFSNLFIRLLYGCCVIKVESPLGFRQWYYDRIEPWRHFVPVAADLSDLMDVIAWCHGHPRECGEIAAAGQQVALEMTPATERAAAIRTLCAAHESDADDMVVSLPSRDTAGDRRQHRRAA